MDPADLIKREARYGRTAGVLGIIGTVLILLLTFGGLGSAFYELEPDAYAERLEIFDTMRGEILAAQLMQAFGLLLLAPPLLYLFQAAMYRNSTVRRPFMILTIAGPVLYALALIVFYVGYASAATTFLDSPPTGDINQFAEDTLTDTQAYGIFLGLQLAAALALVFAVVYTSLQAMRAGLLTRFLGTLGMAVGVGFLIFGPLGPLALALYLLAISLLIAGWWRGPRPPAWAAGEAIPWPKGGKGAPPTPEEELADMADFEGTATELDADEPVLEDIGEGEGEGGSRSASADSDSESDWDASRPRRRKRKKRD